MSATDAPPILSGRYQILRQLGEGGMGVVYLARDNTLKCEVVIKMPLRSALAEPGLADRFAREIRSMVALTHPHIVKIQDVGAHDGVPFCVMQYLSGGNLQERPAPADPATLAGWLPAVAAALDFVHTQKYLHRDIKPANILFDAHGNAYISDFGVTKVLSEKAATARATELTGEGLVVGTPGYLAPELIMGSAKVDGRADQYALAATVYQVLAGRLPFEGSTREAIIVQQAAGKLPPLRQFAPRVPAGVAEAVEKGLSRDPQRRYPSCAAFAEAVLQSGNAGAPAAKPAGARPTGGAGGKSATGAAKKVAPPRDRAEEEERPTRASGATKTAKARAPRATEEVGTGTGAKWAIGLAVAALVLAGMVVGGVFAVRAFRPGKPDVQDPPPPPATFELHRPGTVTVTAGTSTTVRVRIERSKDAGAVRVVAGASVPGVKLGEGTIPQGASEVNLRLDVTDSAATGTHEVQIKATGAEGEERLTYLVVSVVPPKPDLQVRLPSPAPTVWRGGERVSVRVEVFRKGCDNKAAQYEVDDEKVRNLGVLVLPTQGQLDATRNYFDVEVEVTAEAGVGATIELPITVVVRLAARKLEQSVVLRLPVAKMEK
jgi:hypothetical protein